MTGNSHGVYEVHVFTAVCDQCGRKSDPIPTRDALFASTTLAGLGWSLVGPLAYCPPCTEGRAMTQIVPLSFTIAALESEAAPLDELLQELNEINDRRVAVIGLIELATSATHKLRVLGSLTKDVLNSEERIEIVGGSVESRLRAGLNHRSVLTHTSLEFSRESAEPEAVGLGTSVEAATDLPAETPSEASPDLPDAAHADAIPEATADSSPVPTNEAIPGKVQADSHPLMGEAQADVVDTAIPTLRDEDAEPQADASQPTEAARPDDSASSDENAQAPAGDVPPATAASAAAEEPVLSQPERVRAWVLEHAAEEFDARQVGEALGILASNVRKHLALLATGGLIAKVPGTGVAPNVPSRYRLSEPTIPAPAAEGQQELPPVVDALVEPPDTELSADLALRKEGDSELVEPEPYRPSARAQVLGWITRRSGEEFTAAPAAEALGMTIKSVLDVLNAFVRTGDVTRVSGDGSDESPYRYRYVVWQGPTEHQKPVALPSPVAAVPEMDGEYVPPKDLPLKHEELEVLKVLHDRKGCTVNALRHKLGWPRPQLDRAVNSMVVAGMIAWRGTDLVALRKLPKVQA